MLPPPPLPRSRKERWNKLALRNARILYFQTSVQVPAPTSGVIEELLVPDGERVETGMPLFKLRKGGELS